MTQTLSTDINQPINKSPISNAQSSIKKDSNEKAGPDFTGVGAFKIDDQWATAIRYEASVDEDKVTKGKLKFTNGRKQIGSVNFTSREEAIELIGERNVLNIEALKGKEATNVIGTIKGKLQSENLAFKESATPDKVIENSIERDDSYVKKIDDEVRAWIAKRRDRNIKASIDTGVVNKNDKDLEDKPTAKTTLSKENDIDRSKNVPDSVKARFLQVDNKFFYPDKSPAFSDQGNRLATHSKNQEIIRSLVAIADARGWESITIKGSEDFRRAAWLEASLNGIQVNGYKASQVDKAHLNSLLEKSGRDNILEQNKEQRKAMPNSSERVASTDSKETNVNSSKNLNSPPEEKPLSPAKDLFTLRPGVVTGVLLEHGAAKFQNDPKKENSYFVKLQTSKGEKTLWGVDLERAMAESGINIGEKVAVEKVGKETVTARERVFDDKGEEVGERKIPAHRNQWFIGSLDKASAFADGKREEVVQRHPDLAPAYGTIAATRKLAEKIFPDNKEDQERLLQFAKEIIVEKIAHGEKVASPKIRETRVKENPRDKENESDKNAPSSNNPNREARERTR